MRKCAGKGGGFRPRVIFLSQSHGESFDKPGTIRREHNGKGQGKIGRPTVISSSVLGSELINWSINQMQF